MFMMVDGSNCWSPICQGTSSPHLVLCLGGQFLTPLMQIVLADAAVVVVLLATQSSSHKGPSLYMISSWCRYGHMYDD